MGSTRTVQSSLNWMASLIEQQPTAINGMEPALTAANMVLGVVLGAPFTWPWNRGQANFNATTQDTAVAGLTDFGFLEGGSVYAAGAQSPMAIIVKRLLEQDTSQARALHMSIFEDDGAGNITFRLSPGPDQEYSCNAIYQKKPPVIQSLGYLWSPVPDEKAYLCDWGLLSLMSLIGNDARFNEYNQKFVLSMLQSQGGLEEMERNIFIANWTLVTSQFQSSQLRTAQRVQARQG